MVNSEHIISKTQYLKSVKNQYFHILIKNNGSNIQQYGEDIYKTYADKNIVNLKWKLREKYNPKLINVNLQPSKNLSPGISHNHIIHITDTNKECIEVCNYLLNKKPKEYLNKKINNIYIPWHLDSINQIKKINVNMMVRIRLQMIQIIIK